MVVDIHSWSISSLSHLLGLVRIGSEMAGPRWNLRSVSPRGPGTDPRLKEILAWAKVTAAPGAMTPAPAPVRPSPLRWQSTVVL